MDLSLNIYAMNGYTRDTWMEGVFEEAGNRENPLPYLKVISTIEVVIDDSLKDGVIEVYDKNTYQSLMEEEGESGG